MKRTVTGSGLILAAVALGILTAAAAFSWLSREDDDREAQAQAIENTRPAVVAIADVQAGTRLTSAMVEVRDMPEAALLAGTPSDVTAVVGRVARYPLLPGEQVTERKLVTAGEATGAGLAFSVPPGMRGMSVSINEVRGSGGLIVPGDRVDVLVHTDYERLFGPFEIETQVESGERSHPTVITVLQDVLVLAVAQETTPPIDEDQDASLLRVEEAEAQPGAGSVTLAVTPEQAQSLFLAQQEGTVALALRSFGDGHSTSMEPVLRLEPLGTASGGLTAQ